MPRPRALLAIIAAMVPIAVATLIPADATVTIVRPLCLLCGDRGLADLLVNVALFMPLGAALHTAGWPFRRVLLAALGGALAIELAQAFLPGRAPTLRDAITNGAGALLGAWCWQWIVERRTRSRATSARDLVASMVALALALGVIALTGFLGTSAMVDRGFFGQWDPGFTQMATWDGRVLDARIGEVHLPSERLGEGERIRALLLEGAALRVEAIAGPAPTGAAPIFGLADGRGDHYVLVAQDGDDIVLYVRRRADDWRLESTPYRFPHALAGVVTGDTTTITVDRIAHARPCVDVDGERNCAHAAAAGSAWRYLYAGASWPAWSRALLDALTLACLALPVGLMLYPAPRGSALAVTLILLTFGIPTVAVAMGLAEPTLAEFAGLGAGFGLGAWGWGRSPLHRGAGGS